MKIRMLGTGYGRCEVKRAVSKDFRGRGGVIIDDKILIDAPRDLKDTADGLGFKDAFTDICDVFISHSHEGHFSAAMVDFIARRHRVRVYATAEVLVQLTDNPNIVRCELSPFASVKVGGYTVCALPSNHSTENLSEACLNFLFLGDKNFLYALDGAGIHSRAWSVLREVVLDAVIFECALEAKAPGAMELYHNGIHTLAHLKELMQNEGVASEKTKFIVAHIPTDKRRSIHDELSPIASRAGLILSYDGYYARI